MITFNLNILKTKKFRFPDVLAEIKRDKKLYSKLRNLMAVNKWSGDQALYHLVYPKAQTICQHPDCDNVTVYERNGNKWGYRAHCCSSCAQNNPLVRRRHEQACLDKYGVSNPSQSEKIKAKKTKTCRHNYGVDNPFQSEEIKTKIKASVLKRFGVDHPSQSEEIKQKNIDTCRKNFGVDYPSQSRKIRKKMIASCIKHYGVDNPSKSPVVIKRIQTTFKERYGVNCAMQVSRFFSKCQNNAHKSKQIELDGKTFNYRGYEGHALKVLHHQLGIPVKKMSTVTGHQKKIWWWGKHRTTSCPNPKNAWHRYFTDIRIKYKGKDISVEVKSDYYSGYTNAEIFNEVKAKCQAAFDAGVDLRVWVVFPKTKKIIRLPNFQDLSRKQLAKQLGK